MFAIAALVLFLLDLLVHAAKLTPGSVLLSEPSLLYAGQVCCEAHLARRS